ncbi:MAG: LD-carboxypeptidase [Erysipelotrichaceae bacterium]|nr:LD-carboxypeptidase [Erysipelotrichaceae bacterium]
MHYPRFIEKGQTIGICAPSAGVGNKLEHFDKALENLRAEGFRIKESASVRKDALVSASAKKRAKEFKEMFTDPEVDFVLCAAGGDFLMEMLPYTDFEAVVKNPKWFMGMSDPSTLLFILPTKYDIATLYGMNVGGFDCDKICRRSVRTAVDHMQGKWSLQRSYKQYLVGIGAEDLPKAPVRYKAFPESFTFEGRLIGGCVDALRDIIGSDLDAVHEFNERYKDEGIVWFFDNFALSAEDLYHTLFAMKQNRWFENVNAVLMGRTLFESTMIGFKYKEALQKIFGRKIPIAMEMDIGHTSPYFTLVNGSYVKGQIRDGKGSLRCIQK